MARRQAVARLGAGERRRGGGDLYGDRAHGRLLAAHVTVTFVVGIYGYPPEEAAPVAVAAVRELADRFDEVRFVVVDEAVRRVYADTAERLG